jgi:Phage integrase family
MKTLLKCGVIAGPLLERANLPRVRVYDLRHTTATLLLGAGENPKIVAERLGHNSVRQTLDSYSHVGLEERWSRARSTASRARSSAIATRRLSTLWHSTSSAGGFRRSAPCSTPTSSGIWAPWRTRGRCCGRQARRAMSNEGLSCTHRGPSQRNPKPPQNGRSHFARRIGWRAREVRWCRA